MKKILISGVALLSLVACSGSFQTNKAEKQTIIRSKFGEDLPQWVRKTLTEENGKTYFVSEIVRDEKSNNTAHLERVASLDAAAQLAQMAAQRVNAVVQASNNAENTKSASSSLSEISETNIKLSTVVPTDSYWQLIEYPNGEREYHAYSRVRIDTQELKDAITTSFEKANPGVSKATTKSMVDKAMDGMRLSDVRPDEKIF